MTETTEKPTVIEALLAVMEDVQAVGKTGRNQQQNYDFRGIDAVVNAVGPAFRRHGVIAVPAKSEARYRDVQTTRGNPSRECTVTVTYRFYGPAGDYIDAEVPGESMDSGDKGTAKAMSVAYRIVLLQALCIPTDEADPDSQSYERAPAPAATEPVTDPDWLTRMEEAITGATSSQELETTANEIKAADQAGQVSRTHGQHLFHLYQQKQGELAGQGAS